jgi:hypothetical protein
MRKMRVIEGTAEEIADLPHSGALAGMRVRLVVERDDGEIGDTLSDPPNTVRDVAHLEALLLKGLGSPLHPVTDRTRGRNSRGSAQAPCRTTAMKLSICESDQAPGTPPTSGYLSGVAA